MEIQCGVIRMHKGQFFVLWNDNTQAVTVKRIGEPDLTKNVTFEHATTAQSKEDAIKAAIEWLETTNWF